VVDAVKEERTPSMVLLQEVTAMRTPVILDVNPEPEALEWEQDFLSTRLEVGVLGCCGPETNGGCPLLNGQPCGKVEAADGILFQLDLDRPQHRAILLRYIASVDVPIRVLVSEDQKERWAPLLRDVEVFTPPVGPAKLDAFVAEVSSETE
jgi:hypothetical protein